MNGHQTNCDDHFTVYINIELLCCTLEINIMLYTNYIPQLKRTGTIYFPGSMADRIHSFTYIDHSPCSRYWVHNDEQEEGAPALIELIVWQESLVREREERSGISLSADLVWQSCSLKEHFSHYSGPVGDPAECRLTHKNGLLHFCWHVICIWWSNIFIMKLDENSDAQTNR